MVGKRSTPARPPGYYQEQERRRKAAGNIVKTTWRPGTTYKVAGEMLKWKRFCHEAYERDDFEAVLLESDPDKYTSYLEWIIDNSSQNLSLHFQKCSWRLLRMRYRELAGGVIPFTVDRHMTMVFDKEGYLAKTYGLNLKAKDKPIMDMDCFMELISLLLCTDKVWFAYHASRIDFWLWQLLGGFSGCRPGSMFDNTRHIKRDQPNDFEAAASEPQVVCYKDCRLSLTTVEGCEFPKLNLKVTLNRIKGGGGKVKPVTYIYHHNEILALCPITAFLTKAFADEAFANPSITPHTFYNICHVTNGLVENTFSWKDEWMEIPIFRNRKGKLMNYNQVADWTMKIGKAAGITKPLTTYAVRRMVGNSIESVPVVQRTLALGQRDPGTYERSYQSDEIKFDLQNMVLGKPTEDKFIKACQQMRRFVDPRFPCTVCEDEKRTVMANSPTIQILQQQVAGFRQQCLDQYGSLTAAKKTPSYQDFARATYAIISETRILLAEAIRQKQEVHRRHAPVDDVERLVAGLPSTVPEQVNDVLDPLRAKAVQRLFSEESEGYVEGSLEDAARRSATIEALVDLYGTKACQPKTSISKTRPRKKKTLPEKIFMSRESQDDDAG